MNLCIKRILFLVLVIFLTTSFSIPSYQIALLKYNGGGDWYANPTSLPNLVKFANKNLGTNIGEDVIFMVAAKDVRHHANEGDVGFRPGAR